MRQLAEPTNTQRVIPDTLPAGLFSATQTEAVEQLARAGLRNPVRVNVVTGISAPAPAPAARAGAVPATPADEGAQPAAAAAAAAAAVPGTQRTPASLALQYMVCESTQKLDVLAAFLQVGPCSCRHSDQSILRMTGGVGMRALGNASGACRTPGCCRHAAAINATLCAQAYT